MAPTVRAATNAGPVRRTARRAAVVVEALEPTCAVRRTGAVPAFAVGGIYRYRNAGLVRAIIDGLPAGVRSAWWALDRPCPSLSAWTIGTGPGPRPQLLNRIAGTLMTTPDDHLVLCDDDWRFAKGDFALLLRTVVAAGLDVSQPSHTRRSNLSWGVTRHRVGSVVRLSRFVEQGPVIVFSPRARRRVLPLPTDLGMGWGIETVWARESTLRLGVVDGTTIDHLTPVGAGYDTAAQNEQALRLLRAIGVGWDDLQRELGRWRWAGPRPPWVSFEEAA